MLLKSSTYLPEWCREGGSGHHGQRASSSREICVWDFPTSAAVHQVVFLSSVMSINNMLIFWYIFRLIVATNCLWFCCYSSDTLLSHVEQLLRAFILKISVCDAVLNNNPPGNLTDYYASLIFNTFFPNIFKLKWLATVSSCFFITLRSFWLTDLFHSRHFWLVIVAKK